MGGGLGEGGKTARLSLKHSSVQHCFYAWGGDSLREKNWRFRELNVLRNVPDTIVKFAARENAWIRGGTLR